MLPPFWNKRNPIDLVATVDPEPYKVATELLMKDKRYGIVLLIGYGTFGRISNMLFHIPKEDTVAKETAKLVKECNKPLKL